ncbi:MAG: AAA family ATPase [Paludibacteraceae bacterium]|nr:AAA family ATPase [Paludibacteraceae bacterium]
MVDIQLHNYMLARLRVTPGTFHRYLYTKVNWDARLVGIVGPRGVGKSTMLLQRIKEENDVAHSLYVDADNSYFTTHSLYELADEFVKDGGRHLYIDEIHKYVGWSRNLKQVYDTHPELKVTYTGSSVLDILKGEADLSRRSLLYHIQGLSFREYLELFHEIKSPVFSLEDILGHKVEISDLLHPLPYFRQYLVSGYYPFALEGDVDMRLQQVIQQTVEQDILQYIQDMKASTARKLRQMISIIAGLAPVKPNADNLARELSISKNNVSEYLNLLERAGMLGQLRDDTGGLRGLGKVEKVYVDNSNLMYALLLEGPNIGNVRETFFYNQMRVNNPVLASKESDFKIGEYTFEVGGMKKGKKQIKDVPNGLVVRDDIEYGAGNILPLWHFGLNY